MIILTLFLIVFGMVGGYLLLDGCLVLSISKVHSTYIAPSSTSSRWWWEAAGCCCPQGQTQLALHSLDSFQFLSHLACYEYQLKPSFIACYRFMKFFRLWQDFISNFDSWFVFDLEMFYLKKALPYVSSSSIIDLFVLHRFT